MMSGILFLLLAQRPFAVNTDLWVAVVKPFYCTSWCRVIWLHLTVYAVQCLKLNSSTWICRLRTTHVDKIEYILNSHTLLFCDSITLFHFSQLSCHFYLHWSLPVVSVYFCRTLSDNERHFCGSACQWRSRRHCRSLDSTFVASANLHCINVTKCTHNNQQPPFASTSS